MPLAFCQALGMLVLSWLCHQSPVFGQAVAGSGPGAPSASSGSGGSVGAGLPGYGGSSAGLSTGASQSGAPGIVGAGPGVGTTSKTLGGATPIALTLEQVVDIILGNNSTVIIARHRLQQAIEQINQLNAQEKPQVRAVAADTYNSYEATSTNLISVVSNPVLPSGGAIPTVTDQAASGTQVSSYSTVLQITSAGITGLAATTPAGSSSPSAGIGTAPAAPAASGAPTGLSPAVSAGASPGIGMGVGAGVGTNNGTGAGIGSSTNSGSGSGTVTGQGAGSGASSPNGSSFSATPASAQSSSVIRTDQYDARTSDLPPILRTFILASAGDGALLASADDAAPHEQVSSDPTARSEANPALTALAAANAPHASDTVSASDQSVVEGSRDTYGALVTGSQYVDLFGYFSAARAVQYAVRDFYALDLERVLNETSLTAKGAFFNVLYAQDEVAVNQEQVNYSTENLRIVTAQRQQGLAADYDVLTARTELANAQQLLTQAQNQLELAQSQLGYLLGTDPDQQITLVPPTLPPLDQAIDLNYSIETADKYRPELRQASRNVDMANRLVKLAGETIAPTLGIVGEAEYNSVETSEAPRSFGTLSAQLDAPIDDGGQTRSRVRSAKIDVQTQVINYSALKLSVALEVRQAVLNVANAQTEIGTAQVATQEAEEALRLADIRYRNGLGTFLDVTNALAQLATARNNLADSQFTYETALATLVRNEGGR